jgi:hypothetical protein
MEPGVFNRVQGYGHRLSRLVHSLARSTNPATASGTGCNVDTVVMTLCMPLCEHMPWRDIPASTVGATRKAALLPENWTAPQLSAFFCQRPDWAWLVPVFTCLWKAYADSEPEALAIITKLCTTSPGASTPCALTMAVDAFFHQHGHNPHPCILLRNEVPISPQKRVLEAHVTSAKTKKRAAAARTSDQSNWEQCSWQQLQASRPRHQ